MTLPEPAWRVKTRPCPFYQQGRCYFSDSCNFLHTVSVKAKPDVALLESLSQASDTPKPTHIRAPVVTVESPRSNPSPESPSQSPRLASLLSALGNVVREGHTNSIEESDMEDDGGSASEVYTVANNLNGPASANPVALQEESRSSSRASQDGWTMIEPLDGEDTHSTQTEPNSNPQSEQETQPAAIQPPIDPQDAVAVPQPTSSPELSHLLSPVDSSLELAHFPSLRFQENEKREDTIDSGYADVTVPPPNRASILSPPRSPVRTSTFDLLSSPFGSLTTRVLSPRLSAFIPRSPVSPVHTALPSPGQSTSQLEPESPELDSPSNYHSASHALVSRPPSNDEEQHFESPVQGADQPLQRLESPISKAPQSPKSLEDSTGQSHPSALEPDDVSPASTSPTPSPPPSNQPSMLESPGQEDSLGLLHPASQPSSPHHEHTSSNFNQLQEQEAQSLQGTSHANPNDAPDAPPSYQPTFPDTTHSVNSNTGSPALPVSSRLSAAEKPSFSSSALQGNDPHERSSPSPPEPVEPISSPPEAPALAPAPTASPPAGSFIAIDDVVRSPPRRTPQRPQPIDTQIMYSPPEKVVAIAGEESPSQPNESPKNQPAERDTAASPTRSIETSAKDDPNSSSPHPKGSAIPEDGPISPTRSPTPPTDTPARDSRRSIRYSTPYKNISEEILARQQLSSRLADIRKSFAMAFDFPGSSASGANDDDEESESESESDDEPAVVVSVIRTLQPSQPPPIIVQEGPSPQAVVNSTEEQGSVRSVQDARPAPRERVSMGLQYGLSYFSGVSEVDPFAAMPGDSWLAPALDFESYNDAYGTAEPFDAPIDQPINIVPHAPGIQETPDDTTRLQMSHMEPAWEEPTPQTVKEDIPPLPSPRTRASLSLPSPHSPDRSNSDTEPLPLQQSPQSPGNALPSPQTASLPNLPEPIPLTSPSPIRQLASLQEDITNINIGTESPEFSGYTSPRVSPIATASSSFEIFPSNSTSPQEQEAAYSPQDLDPEDANATPYWGENLTTPRAEWFSDGPARAVSTDDEPEEDTPNAYSAMYVEQNSEEDEKEESGTNHDEEAYQPTSEELIVTNDVPKAVDDYSALLAAASGSPRQTLSFLPGSRSPSSPGGGSYLESVEEEDPYDEDYDAPQHPTEAISVVPSPAAQLAYLDSTPSSPVPVDESIYALYDGYDDDNGNDSSIDDTSRSSTDYHQQSLLAAAASSSSLTSLSISSMSSLGNLIPERTHTPPPSALSRRESRRRSALNMTPGALNSPSSLRSPSLSSIGSVSRSRGSPLFSSSEFQHRQRSSSGSHSPLSGGQEVQVSTKVPFGFRRSISLGKARGSSLMTSRMSRTGGSAPPSAVSSPTESKAGPAIDSVLDAIVSPTNSSGRPLKPLRLSALITSATPPSASTSRRSPRNHSPGVRASMLSTSSVSSSHSLSSNPLLSSSRLSLIPEQPRPQVHSNDSLSPLSSSSHFPHLSSFDEPRSAPLTRRTSWRTSSPLQQEVTEAHRSSSHVSGPREALAVGRDENDIPPRSAPESQSHIYEFLPSSRRSSTSTQNSLRRSRTVQSLRRSIVPIPQSAPVSRSSSMSRPRESVHAIATPKPTLMFAIASDDVEQVKKVLESGEAGPNDNVGPQSALEFALTNDKLTKKMEIVKTLLAHGADPSVMKKLEQQQQKRLSQAGAGLEDGKSSVASSHGKTNASAGNNHLSALDIIDPATKYYVARADAPHTRRTSALIYRSFFRPLTKVRYELIGQDRALEQLFRVLSIHSRQLSATPIVVLLCGPSGHGKSLLARKFGALLDVPTHTVNMTTLRSTLDLWKSYSMSPYETPTTCTLAEFLINNEGKRCVVVLDEIEKTEDEKYLWSLLMPWELGRCAFEANSRHVDVRNVIWLGTSNIGHDLVFQHHEARKNQDEMMLREEYVSLMESLRPRVSERLGASILSRVTTVLPFVPFTTEEKRAICSEALYNLAGESLSELSPESVESIINQALGEYIVNEGARSLYRAVSNQLIDLV
ncbi:hypothetical protein AX16_006689 [Volvariella volvacea WC 439]|nr:hypothetical protein AX16_006689 [Volvariella volvacea WC 439]